MTVFQAASSGSLENLLRALRDLIAKTIDDGCAPRDLVGLSRRLIDLAAELEALEVQARTLTAVRPRKPFDKGAI